MGLEHMKVFNEFYMPLIIERLGQRLEAFNAASRNALQLTTESFAGDFYQESFFKNLNSAQRRVDMYAANDDIAAVPLSQAKQTMVKIGGSIGPVTYEPAAFKWLDKADKDGAKVISEQYSEIFLRDMINTAIAALVGAISNEPKAVFDAGTNPITQSARNSSHAKFGDASNSLVATIMSGAMMHQLIGQNIANESRLFSANNVTVYDVFGKSIVVTDAKALTVPAVGGEPAKDIVLALVEGAATVTDAATNAFANINTVNKRRIESSLQVDYNFSLGIKGYDWDTTYKSPTNEQIATGVNWTNVMDDIKNTAGVMAIGRAAA